MGKKLCPIKAAVRPTADGEWLVIYLIPADQDEPVPGTSPEAARMPHGLFLDSPELQESFRELADAAVRYANWKASGVRPGTTFRVPTAERN